MQDSDLRFKRQRLTPRSTIAHSLGRAREDLSITDCGGKAVVCTTAGVKVSYIVQWKPGMCCIWVLVCITGRECQLRLSTCVGLLMAGAALLSYDALNICTGSQISASASGLAQTFLLLQSPQTDEEKAAMSALLQKATKELGKSRKERAEATKELRKSRKERAEAKKHINKLEAEINMHNQLLFEGLSP